MNFMKLKGIKHGLETQNIMDAKLKGFTET